MRVDAHQHFWQPARGDYHWMPKDNPILNRVYGPADLISHLQECGMDGTVVVQAAATVHETEYLLGLADASPAIKGVVGWVDFENPEDIDHLRRLSKHPKFLGVRPMIQDIPDVNWMLRDDIQWAFEALVDLDLTFDALGFPEHISNFLALMKRYPDMRVVYDHCMKPQITDQRNGRDAFSEWAEGMALLATETCGYCKLSALVTEAGDNWATEDLRPFVDHVFDVFGADRVMWGSDWPVCRLQSDYQNWHDVSVELTQRFSERERAELFGGTAVRFYRLS
ncbi:MAG: amidohydrolase family protein [Roseobacter sp.]